MESSEPIIENQNTFYNGQLETKPSQESQNHRAGRWPFGAARQGCSTAPTAKKPEEVEAEAKARVLSEGGDPRNGFVVLSRCAIQFGMYKGRDFKWLLENDVSYVAKQVAYHQREREHTTIQSPLVANMDSLTRYAIAYHDVVNEVRVHRGYEEAKERSLLPGQEGEALIGFGKYKTETLQDLYKIRAGCKRANQETDQQERSPEHL
ncbi:Hypothetical protein SMAX5B_003614 [Scophthalmus maximus]|uniref:Uncharacterized protein n=1 Tax=Scophthalmus maximus TaxID=52904 RepID=A0A2U9AX01_SCOMX|nr:Hypothetical protein SMAX5B_003614 [Scophthalmus maximus]